MKVFAQLINEQIRSSLDWVVRYGGEEFLFILPETSGSGAHSLAERLCTADQQKAIAFEDIFLEITSSFGGACTRGLDKPQEKITMEHLIRRADEMLYQSK